MRNVPLLTLQVDLVQTFEKASAEFPWIMDFQDRSITELEIRHAVLNDGLSATSQRAKFYVRSSQGVTGDEPGAQLLRRLKDEVVACGATSREYNDVEIFAQRVLSDLKNQIELDFPQSFVICFLSLLLPVRLTSPLIQQPRSLGVGGGKEWSHDIYAFKNFSLRWRSQVLRRVGQARFAQHDKSHSRHWSRRVRQSASEIRFNRLLGAFSDSL
jgi:hypothetical protein